MITTELRMNLLILCAFVGVGKMGYTLAEAFAFRGAQVTLISGPSHESVFINV